jgi:hypothetical protein
MRPDTIIHRYQNPARTTHDCTLDTTLINFTITELDQCVSFKSYMISNVFHDFERCVKGPLAR